MNNLEKFFEEVYNEANRLHFSEVTISKLIQAVHNDAGEGQNANLRFHDLKGVLRLYLQGINTNVEWYGKGEDGAPHYTAQEFRQRLANAVDKAYENLSVEDRCDLIQSVLITWFGDDGTKEFTTDQIMAFVDNYRHEHENS